VKPVANRPSTQPVQEVENAEFKSCAPGLPLHRLGGGLMKECVNLEIKNGRLRSRDKLKLYMDNGNMPNFFANDGEKRFFTIPYKGRERKFWISSVSRIDTSTNQIFFLNAGNVWVELYRDRETGNGWDLSGFNVFRMNNLFNSNLWVLSIESGFTLVLVNDATPKLRELGMRNVPDMSAADNEESNKRRGYGFDYAEIVDGVAIRSSGVKTNLENNITTGSVTLTLDEPNNQPTRATHVRLWLSDRFLTKSDDPNNLFRMVDFPLADLNNLAVNSTKKYSGRNNFTYTAKRTSSATYGITITKMPLVGSEPSYGAAEASLVETMNLIPIPNAQCLSNDGILFGIKPDGVIAYSSNPGTIYQEQTTTLKVLQAGVGELFRLVSVNNGILAFGTKGIARVASLGGGDFAVSRIAALDLSGMRAIALPGIGAVCCGKGRVIFVYENSFEISENFMGLPIGEMLGEWANDMQAVNIANNKLYIIAGDGNNAQRNRLFSIDLNIGAMIEIRMLSAYPVDLFSGDNSSIFITGKRDGNQANPIVVSSEGSDFEDNLQYIATFVESSAYGFIQHKITQVLAKLGKCNLLEASINDNGHLPPMQFATLREKYGNDYQDYLIPAGERSEAKTIEAKIVFESPSGGSDNDGLDILSVKLTRMRQDEVSSPSYNMGY